MADFFEIDFLDVEAKSSGDAICVGYELNGQTFIHVVDGGYQSTREKVVNFINRVAAIGKSSTNAHSMGN